LDCPTARAEVAIFSHRNLNLIDLLLQAALLFLCLLLQRPAARWYPAREGHSVALAILDGCRACLGAPCLSIEIGPKFVIAQQI
jgi:hypothetical protein